MPMTTVVSGHSNKIMQRNPDPYYSMESVPDVCCIEDQIIDTQRKWYLNSTSKCTISLSVNVPLWLTWHNGAVPDLIIEEEKYQT